MSTESEHKTAMEICQTCFGSGYHHRFARNWPCPNGCLPPGNRISEQLSAYGIAKIISSHAPMNAAFAIVDLIQSERSLARSGFTYPHMCRDGHPEIGHSDNSSEMCPLCRARADTDALRMCCDNAERSYMAERDNSLRLVAERDAARADADGRVAEVLEAYSKRPTRKEYDKALRDVAELVEALRATLEDCRRNGECSDPALLTGEYCCDECAALAVLLAKHSSPESAK